MKSIEEIIRDDKQNREYGFYWVRFNDGDWIVAMWFYNYWLLPGSQNKKPDDYFLEINETRIKNISTESIEAEKQLASQNEELIKENEELQERVINLQQADMTHEYNNAEAARVWPQIEEQIREDERQKLQSTIDEKNKEFEQMIVDKNKLLFDNLKWQAEIERLKGLIEDSHNSGWRRGYSLHAEIGESLQQFKSDNNL